jgi:hypothetical protein
MRATYLGVDAERLEQVRQFLDEKVVCEVCQATVSIFEAFTTKDFNTVCDKCSSDLETL